jgi:hypothetical protein
MGSRFRRAGFSLLMLLAAAPGAAAWISNGAVLCGATGDQHTPTAISDGTGGAIVVWEDRRDGAGDIYVQRLAANGTPLWSENGVALCTASGEQITPSIVADGAGGAIVAWEDLRGSGSDVYAQRIDASGTPRWTPDGVPVCSATGVQTAIVAVSDGAGGAIVAWADGRGANSDIYAQRIDGSGTTRWAPNGVALILASGEQSNPVLAADGMGGAVVAWSDVLVEAQRVDSLGALQWGLGVPVCTTSGFQFSPSVVADGAGGAIVTWTDMRTIFDQDVYAQRIGALGTVQWGDSGKAVCALSGYQFGPVSLADGSGGAVVAWRDVRGSSTDLYAQHLDAAGTTTWMPGGVALCDAEGEQFSPVIAALGGGNVIAAWHDQRGVDSDVYARSVTSGGVLQWNDGGVVVCGTAGDQQSASVVADGKGGAIVVWDDGRGSAGSDLYAARIAGDGVLVPVSLALASASATPGQVRLLWHAPGRAGVAAVLERRTPSIEYQTLAHLVLDASGLLSYEDRDVAPGQRYGYRVTLTDGASRSTVETWIEVPTGVALAIESVRPQPIEREGVVALTLPSAAPARLELFDVRGRRVVDRDLGALGAGRHLVRLDETSRLGSGVYVMRLIQGEASVAAKLLVRR